MRQIILAAVLAFGAIATAKAGVDIQVNIGSAPYYGYAPRDVVYVERYVPAPYVPRVLILSRYAHVPPHRIVRHYRDGWGWDRMYNHYRVAPRVIYEQEYVGRRGKGNGHWKHDRDDRRYRHDYRR